MAVTVAPLVHAKHAEATQTTQYTSGTGTRTIVDKMTATNVSGEAAALSVNLVPSAGSPAASNLVVSAKALAPGECYTLPEIVGQVLGPGDSLSTLASAAGSIVIRVSGRKVTT